MICSSNHRYSNTCSKTWNRATITTRTSQSTIHPREELTRHAHARSLETRTHARTHASWERRSCVLSILLAPRRKLGERARRRTNGEGRRGEGKERDKFPCCPSRIYHCPRIPAELRVHGNKGKCASPIGSDRSAETVNPVAIYVAVISIIQWLLPFPFTHRFH